MEELEMVKRSVFDPSLERLAVEHLLRGLYEEVRRRYRGRASNGGLLAPLAVCDGVCEDDAVFTYNALRLLMDRYLARDEEGRIVETPSMLMRRVAMGFRGRVSPERLYRLLISRRFMFNSPTLFNMFADGAKGALSACYVTPIYDDMKSIMDAVAVQALTFKYGGGQGFSFSNLRPRGDIVRGTGSTASGPISFMALYDKVTDAVKQGGKRRGANMGILHVWHPDVYNPGFDASKAFNSFIPRPLHPMLGVDSTQAPEEAGFIQAKRGRLGDVFLTNFNISVAVNDAFMEAVARDGEWVMVNPRLTGTTTGEGDYRIVYTISRATGPGTALPHIEARRLHEVNPYINIYEDIVGRAVDGSELPSKRSPRGWRAPARLLFEEMARSAWESGDPGLFLVDNHNKWSPTPWLGVVAATNPCVSGDTLILTPSTVMTAEKLWKTAKIRGLTAAIAVDPTVLGEGGERWGYTTWVMAPAPLSDGLAIIEAQAIVWRVGRKNGARIRLASGHEVTVTLEHKILARVDGRLTYVEAMRLWELMSMGSRVEVPVFSLRLVEPGEPTRPARVLAALLLSKYERVGDGVKIKPLVDVSSLLSDCQVEERDGWLLVRECHEAVEMAARDPASLPSTQSIHVLAAAARLVAEALSRTVGLQDELRERLPVIAFLLQLAGYILVVSDDYVRARRMKGPVEYVPVESVEPVREADFYDFTVPGLHAYIANGLVHHNCGEQPLYPFESCNLGSLSIEKYVKDGCFDLEAFARDIEVVVDAMDAVIDLNKHPDPRQDRANKFTRKIGIGIMGLADALALLGIPYDSDEAVAFTYTVMAALEAYTWRRSWELGALRGPAPAFKCLVYDWRRQECLRPADPRETLEMHTPALVKAGAVRLLRDGWVAVKYHEVDTTWIQGALRGPAAGRVEPDGAVRLFRLSTLEGILSRVFGVTRETLRDALHAARVSPRRAVENPRMLLALAVYAPTLAWRALREYGALIGAEAPRNTVTTTVAPTGSISIIAGTSSGIEPYFALVYKRNVSIGTLLEVVRPFRSDVLRLKRYIGVEGVEKIYEAVSRSKGSLRAALPLLEGELPSLVVNGDAFYVKEELRRLARLYPTALDVHWWYHLAHQIAAQLYVDQAISKTVNLPSSATVDDVKAVFYVAWLGGLKGVTVYRDESKAAQVIDYGAAPTAEEKPRKMRLALPKRRIRLEEAARDPGLSKIAGLRVEDGYVVVDIGDNSTCTTCEF